MFVGVVVVVVVVVVGVGRVLLLAGGGVSTRALLFAFGFVWGIVGERCFLAEYVHEVGVVSFGLA